MQSTEIHSNGHTPAKTEADLNEAVPSAMRVAEGTRATDQHSKQSVTDEFSSRTKRISPSQPKRINPDSGIFIRVVTGGIIALGLVAFAISFVTLYAVAEWLGLPPWMWWAVPVVIDLAILVYAALVLVHRARGEQTWLAWVSLGSFTLLSVIANSAHALSHEHYAVWQTCVAVLIAAMVPVAIFVATEQLSRVAVEDLESRKSDLQEQVEMDIFEAEQQQKREEVAFAHEQRQFEREQQRLRAQWATEVEQRQHEQQMQNIESEPEPRSGEALGSTQERPSSTTSIARETPQKKQSVSDDALVAFIHQQVADGAEITGSLVAEFLGVSDRTGRRRVKELQEQFPDLLTAGNSAEKVQG